MIEPFYNMILYDNDNNNNNNNNNNAQSKSDKELSKDTPSPPSWVRHGVSFVSNLDENHYVITVSAAFTENCTLETLFDINIDPSIPRIPSMVGMWPVNPNATSANHNKSYGQVPTILATPQGQETPDWNDIIWCICNIVIAPCGTKVIRKHKDTCISWFPNSEMGQIDLSSSLWTCTLSKAKYLKCFLWV